MNERTARQIEEMKKQTIGVEVEMNNIRRDKAAEIAAAFFGTGRFENTASRNGYYTWSALWCRNNWIYVWIRANMYLPKGKTEKAEEETMETKITTAENLGMELSGCLNAAVLDYGDYTIAVWDHCFKGSIAEVYELVETPEETGIGRCECRISRIERKEEFEDAGHAMAWALTKVK